MLTNTKMTNLGWLRPVVASAALLANFAAPAPTKASGTCMLCQHNYAGNYDVCAQTPLAAYTSCAGGSNTGLPCVNGPNSCDPNVGS